mmetsp:Transcript_37803/g.48956  ORF Transcript_37803/g.48956 Transcript_37803/m.48956 type:complete len:190 (+) Transcript_37803:625-1194(+)
MGILVSTFFLCVMFYMEPFIEKHDNFLGVVLAYSLTLMFLAALMLKVDISPEDSRDQEVFDVLLVLILMAGPMVIAYQVIVKNLYGTLKVLGCVSWLMHKVGYEHNDEAKGNDKDDEDDDDEGRRWSLDRIPATPSQSKDTDIPLEVEMQQKLPQTTNKLSNSSHVKAGGNRNHNPLLETVKSSNEVSL